MYVSDMFNQDISLIHIVPILADEDLENFRNLSLKISHSIPDDASGTQYWWEVKEECDDKAYIDLYSLLPFADCQNSLVFYTFNDKIFPSTISSYAAGG